MFRKRYLTLVGSISLVLLAVAPVHAAPSLSLGSNAFYKLTGEIRESQNCTAAPANYMPQACFGITPPPPPPPPPTVTVWIRDDGVCGTNDLSCQFVPAFLGLSAGGTIIWRNNGTLAHTIASNNTAVKINSGSIVPGGNFSYKFNFGGTYQYYDPSFPWMKGTINIPIIFRIPEENMPIVPITFTQQVVVLSGNLGWSVEGLSSSQANLNVSHEINVSALPFPGLGIAPVTESGSFESGSFEQSINLSTRVESPSTATALVESFSSSFLSAFAGTVLATGASASIFQNMIFSRSISPDYTMWWVNGPLSLGSPVQILHGWSSVTGSESLNLGTIGTRSAWIVTSQTSERVSLSIPNPSNPLISSSFNATANLKFLWSFDRSADLLLRNDNAASVTMHSETPTTIYNSTGPVSVTVIRDMALTIDVALLLSSTSMSLPKSPASAPSLMDVLSAMPWMPLGLMGLAAGLAAALIVWYTRRSKGAVTPNPAPSVVPAAPPASPSWNSFFLFLGSRSGC